MKVLCKLHYVALAYINFSYKNKRALSLVLTFRDVITGFFFLINLFIYIFWLCWVFVSVRGLSPFAASGGHSSSRCASLSLSRPLLLRSTGSRCAGSVVVAHGPSCSAACGILPDQGSYLCPLNWQADSQPLRHQGSPWSQFYFRACVLGFCSIAFVFQKGNISNSG